MRLGSWIVWGVLAACAAGDKEDDGPADGADGDTDADSDSDSDTDVDSDADADADVDTAETGPTDTGPDPAVAVCVRWNEVREGVTEGSWSGDVGRCDPGDLSADGRGSVLQLWNLYREMAGHGPVASDPGLDAAAQDCALIQHANGFLSHTPDPSSTCYTASGYDAAYTSNISPTPAVEALDLYMADPANETTLGHRRWLLSNGLSTVGIGSTSSYSCHTVIGGPLDGTSREWTAWPPPGPVPAEVWTVSWAHLDDTGWSLQSDSLNLGTGTVTITDDAGTVLPVDVTSLVSGYGSTYAISMIPDGWATQVGRSYTVSVSGLSSPIDYTVDVVDCDAL